MPIPQEQPPLDTPRELTEWLTRQQIATNIELNKSSDFEVLYARPTKEFNGMVRCFGAAIDSTITSAGLWIYQDDGWEKIVTHSDIPVFNAYMSANQTGIANTTWTVAQFDTENFDTHSFFDISTYRFTPTIPGYYQINLTLSGEGNGSVQFNSGLLKNGTTYILIEEGRVSSSGSLTHSGSTIIYLDGDDYIEAVGYIDATSSRIFIAAQTIQFSGHLVRRA